MSLMDVIRDSHAPIRVSFFHNFRRPPYGGGNQFLLALRGEFRRRGLRVENNRISSVSNACLFNSFNFDFERLRSMRRAGCRMVHRLDGPIQRYRGWDDGTDERIWGINREIADVTIFQSHYSRAAHRTLAYEFKAPLVIMNAVNPGIFHPGSNRLHFGNRKVRLISTSWSDHPNKGVATYKWLDKHLDWKRYEYTFVGRSSVTFENIRMMKPVSSRRLARMLQQHDIYIAASLHDPCSNALLEALACGLPAIYANSGGHPEIVGGAGFGFIEQETIPVLLDRLVGEYKMRRQMISIPSIAEVGDQYLAAMGLTVLET